MKKLLIRLALFTTTAVLCYTLLLWVLGDCRWIRTARLDMGSYGHLFTRYREAMRSNGVDVLFIGSSHCYRTFDTRFYKSHGISCFNLGSSNQTPIQSLVLLNACLDSLQPRLIVFEVHYDVMSNDGVESAEDLLINTPVTLKSTLMAFRYKNMRVFNTWLYSIYNQHICHRSNHFKDDSIISNSKYHTGGYEEYLSWHFEPEQRAPKTLSILPAQWNAMCQCLELLRSRNIPYLLVEVQDSEELRASFLNHPWFEEQMHSLGPYRYKVLPLVDSIHFANKNHLSPAGVALFNQDFYSDLVELIDK